MHACTAGDRIPGLWFKKNSGTVLLAQGSAYNLDTESYKYEDGLSSVELPAGEWTTVKVVAAGHHTTMYFNGTEVLALDTNNQTRHPHDNTKVYLSDPWYQPAPASVKNFKYRALSCVVCERVSE